MKNKITWIAYVVLCAIIIWIISSFFIFKYKAWEENAWNNTWEKYQVCCQWSKEPTCFDIEIADNSELRAKWLMFREYLPKDEWMLFVFDKEWIYSFRMKNTLIPLAWIWINEDMNIVDIIPMDPCKTEDCPSYTPNKKAMYVLEINQSLITKKHILEIWNLCYIS